MSEKLGPLQFGSGQSGNVFLGRDFQNEQNYSDAIAHEIDTEIQAIINRCYQKAKDILTEKRDQLDLIATTLLEVETLDQKQIHHLLETGEYKKHEPEATTPKAEEKAPESTDATVDQPTESPTQMGSVVDEGKNVDMDTPDTPRRDDQV